MNGRILAEYIIDTNSDITKQKRDEAIDFIRKLEIDCDTLRDALDEAREALQMYANTNNWTYNYDDPMDFTACIWDRENDNGYSIAAAFLAKYPKP